MAELIDSRFVDTTVQLDGSDFTRCVFRGCRVVISGTAPFSLVDCVFYECSWDFEGPALQTLHALKSLYHDLGEGGRALVEDIFSGIRVAG